MTEFNLEIARPWLLLILIPALVLGIIPFFKLHKKRRKATKHIIPFIIHMILILLLTTLASGIRITETTETPTGSAVMFVVDLSGSNVEMKDDMEKFMHNLTEKSKTEEGEFVFGFVPFANDVMEDAVKKPGELNIDDERYILYNSSIDNSETSKTNIQKALLYAADALTTYEGSITNRVNKRIVLLSDGRETDDEARTVVMQILDKNITIDAAHFDIAKSEYHDEVQITDVTTSGKVELDGDVLVNVDIKSTDRITGATIIIYDKNNVGKEQVVKLEDQTIVQGENRFPFEYTPEGAGVHTLYAEIVVSSDTIEQNNKLSSWYSVDDKGSILIVDGDTFQTRQISEILGEISDDYTYTVKRPLEFPTTMVDLLEYDEVILMNVDISKLPEGADALLKRYVQQNGRGLVVTCGSNTYKVNEQTEASELNDIIPVELAVEDEEENVAIIMVVDLSSSMRQGMGSQGKTRYDAALESIKYAIDGLDEENDYVGVVVFDSSAYAAVPFTPLKGNVDAIKKRIDYEFEHYFYLHYFKADGSESDIRVNEKDDDTYTKEGYIKPNLSEYTLTKDDKVSSTVHGHDGDYIKAHGTYYRWAINEASNMLSAAMQTMRLDVKQIVFMSDGEPSDPNSGYEEAVSLMTKAGVRTSCVSIGGSAITELKEIANMGRGDLVIVKDDDMPEKLFDIVNNAKGEKVNENKDFRPTLYDEGNPILLGISDLDIINGYYGTTIKEGANIVTYVDNLRPLIAEWKTGIGKVTVFMSNLGNSWTSSMFDDTDGTRNRALVKNILISAMNEQVDSSGINITKVKREEGKTRVEVELPLPKSNYEFLIPVLKELDTKTGELVEIVSDKQVTFSAYPGRKRHYIDLDTPDGEKIYFVEVRLVAANTERTLLDRTTTTVVGSYEDEYDIYKVDGEAVLTYIVKMGAVGNNIVNKAEDFFDIERADVEQIIHDAKLPFIVAVLVLFLVALFFRNFVFQKQKKKEQMTDEEQYASMRSSGR